MAPLCVPPPVLEKPGLRVYPFLSVHSPSRIVAVSSEAHKMGGFDISDLNYEKRKV